MLMLRGLRACPPRNILKNKYFDIEFEDISESNYFIMHFTFKIQNKCETKSHLYQHHYGMENIATKGEQVIMYT